MKLLEWLLNDPKKENEEKVTDKMLVRSVVLSVIGILFCMTCLFGLSWAWFTDSIATGSSKITAASFNLDVTVEEINGAQIPKGEDGFYQLDTTKTYKVTLVKEGTAKSGFCHISVKTSEEGTQTIFYTENIPQGNVTEDDQPYVFTVSGVYKIKLTPMWGQRASDSSTIVSTLDLTHPPHDAEYSQEEEEVEEEDEPIDDEETSKAPVITADETSKPTTEPTTEAPVTTAEPAIETTAETTAPLTEPDSTVEETNEPPETTSENTTVTDVTADEKDEPAETSASSDTSEPESQPETTEP
ncbi:MAG: hypothetical protein KBT31_02835 [Firmicutes bacterium]|nr:hypothetical protein [Candidatus Colimorpha enterica]